MDELEKVRLLIKERKMDEAAVLIRAVVNGRVNEAGLHRRWGELAEEAGLLAVAMREYQLALRDDRLDEAALLRLAILYRERGDLEKCLSFLERLASINSLDGDVVGMLVEVCMEEGFEEKARSVLEKARQAGMGEEILSEMASRAGIRKGEAPRAAPEEESDLLPRDADILRFLHLFSGREDTYAMQWWDEKGYGGYTPVRRPLTPQVVKNHLLGNITVGVYPIRLDGTVTFFALDLDINKRALERVRGDTKQAKKLRECLIQDASLVLQTLRTKGFDPLFESSGHKGRHFWVFLEHPEDADVLYKLGSFLLPSLGPIHPEFHLEFFPKQGKTVKQLGNLIKVPLGIHRKTGRRCDILKDDGTVEEKPFERLTMIQKLTRQKLYEIMVSLKNECPVVPPDGQTESEAPGGREEEAHLPMPPLPEKGPAWTEADFETNAKVRQLFSSCPVLAELKGRVDEHCRLTHDEQVVLIHTLGHFPAGLLAVNYLFAKCVNVGREKYLKSVLAGNPISCPRIRKRIPEVTSKVSCRCSFDLMPDSYPTPVLHSMKIPEGMKIEGGRPVARRSPEDLAKSYTLLTKRKAELEKEIGDLGQSLVAALEESPGKAIESQEGKFILKQREGIPEIVWVPPEEKKG
jgi:hypothetical protein